jgi:hypothetical protein
LEYLKTHKFMGVGRGKGRAAHKNFFHYEESRELCMIDCVYIKELKMSRNILSGHIIFILIARSFCVIKNMRSGQDVTNGGEVG